MRIIKKHHVILLAVTFLIGFGFFGELARSAAETPGTSRTARRNDRKPQDPAPTPTPPDTNWAPPPQPTPPKPKQRRLLEADSKSSRLAPLSGEEGVLIARGFTPFPAPTVNLTTEGVVDWAHWGNGGPTVFDHKNNVTQQITNYTVVGTSQIFSLADNPTGFTWTDGTPGASATNVHTGVFAIGVGNGFQFTVPADTNPKTVRINLGLWRARGRLEASLSDSSAPAYSDNFLVNELGTSNGVYVISFAAASAGQTLTIKYTAEAQFHSSGNVTLESASLVNGGDQDQYPIINITSPADEATFSATDSTSILATAFDPDGTIASVEFYVDGVFLGNGVSMGSSQYSVAWPNIYSGAHTITAKAFDNEGARITSDPVNVTAFDGSGGVLQASVYTPPFSEFISLTSLGSVDWGHWGLNSGANFDHKANVTQRIFMTRIGTSPTNWFATGPTTFNWNDGTPTVSGSTQTGVVTGQTGTGGEGYEITVPADTTLKTLKLYLGSWIGIGRFEAAISDGSAPTYVDTSLNSCSGGTFDGIYTIQFKAASAGKKLRVRYTLLQDCDGPGSFGNVTLRAATLANAGAVNLPPSVSITSPSNGFVLNAASPLTITATASDPDGGVGKVEFYSGSTKLGEDVDSPYQFNWPSVPAGLQTIYAVAKDGLGATTTSAPVTIQSNLAPVVDAGYNQSITLPASTTLFGSATDDGLPTSPGTLTYSWTKTSGPGTVSFGTPNSATSTASFSSEGDYVLRLTANDGHRTSFGEVTVGAHPAVTINLNPTADAHVRDGASAGSNFGTATTIEVQSSGTTGENRDAYFKFDLSSVGDINNAKLRIFAATSAAGSVSTSAYPVTNTSWTETGVNWNNRPALGTPVLASVTVSGTTFQTYELDVSNYLIGEKSAGRNTVTLALHNPSTSSIFIKINSKEAASNKPLLVVSTPETAFVSDKTLGTLRNNLNAWVGMKFTTGSAPVTVTSLGRIYVNGNTGTHTVKLVNAGSGADVAGGSVSINLSTGTATNGFKYVALASPVILAANTAYYLASQETSGGDQWYDSNTVLTTTTIASVNNAVQKPNNSWTAAGGANNSFVPVDFKYASTTAASVRPYHLHLNASTTPGLFKLDPAAPDESSTFMLTPNLKGQPLGEYLINAFDTQAPILGKAGFIPAGASAVFTLWMENGGNAGTIFPRVKLNLNNAAGTNLCIATGTTALALNTLTKYTLSCTTSTSITTTATDRYYLWVGVNLTAGSSNKDIYGLLELEGTPNGNYDSQILAPSPVAPTIFQLSPSLGPTGTVVTITGANFGPMQGAVTFNGQPASISSWSSNSVVTTVPASATTGPVVVTANGAASLGVTYTVGPADSDADGLPDVWELQYFGNLLQGPNDDPDGDGATNLQEFNQGRNPSLGTVLDINGLIRLKLHSPLDP